MCGLDEFEVLQQPHEEIQRKAAMERPARMAREKRETRPYVVRDLSWELARYLDVESFPASASATPSSAGGNERKCG
jgi:hypothetical protein